MPLAGKLSILHRISGALLFLCLPLVIVPLFAASVTSPESYAQVAQYAANPLVKLVAAGPDLGLSASLLRHPLPGAGPAYRSGQGFGAESAGVAFGVSLALTLVFGLKLFGVL